PVEKIRERDWLGAEGFDGRLQRDARGSAGRASRAWCGGGRRGTGGDRLLAPRRADRDRLRRNLALGLLGLKRRDLIGGRRRGSDATGQQHDSDEPADPENRGRPHYLTISSRRG